MYAHGLLLIRGLHGVRRRFQQYLQDMEWLALALEDGSSGMLGEATMQICTLAEQRPLAGAVTFVQVTCLLALRLRVKLGRSRRFVRQSSDKA